MAHVVMPGHIGTSIALNSTAAHGGPDHAPIRKALAERGADVDQMSDADLTELVTARGERFRDDAPTSAAEAASIILETVRAKQWRILVGEDAAAIDQLVREDPEFAYEPEFLSRIIDRGHLNIFEAR